jgi:hypothetical protein
MRGVFMGYNAIDKENWDDFFRLFSMILRGQQAEIELASLDVGDQIEGEWAALEDISYDGSEDLLYVSLGEETHLIEDPTDIIVAQQGGSIRSIAIKNADNNLQIIHFRDPILLESPRGGREMEL